MGPALRLFPFYKQDGRPTDLPPPKQPTGRLTFEILKLRTMSFASQRCFKFLAIAGVDMFAAAFRWDTVHCQVPPCTVTHHSLCTVTHHSLSLCRSSPWATEELSLGDGKHKNSTYHGSTTANKHKVGKADGMDGCIL